MSRLVSRYRSGDEPRIEMTPLLDVIFLLLTFFIYSLVLTVRAQVLPVNLPTLSAGEVAAETEIAGITVDGRGELFLNQQPVSRAQLENRLAELADQPQPPAVFLALDAEPAEVDRAPLLIGLIDMMRRLNIEHFQIVGQPPETPDSPAPSDPAASSKPDLSPRRSGSPP